MKEKLKVKNFQEGQVLIVLLLTTLVVLTAGLAITVRSLNDVTISTRNDQSQRAFSAAEAGIEKYLANPATTTGIQSPIPFDNDSSVEIRANIDVPPPPNPPTLPVQPALEYPPIGKDTIAQFWIVDPKSPSVNPTQFFNGSSFVLYFGNPGQTLSGSPDAPAMEVNVITYNTSNQYGSIRYYLDSYKRSTTTTGFKSPGDTGGPSCSSATSANPVYTTSSKNVSDNRNFACSYTINLGSACVSPTCFPVIVRVRLLYSVVNQRIALKANPGTNNNALPRQAEIYYAKGTSGQSQQILKSFKIPKVIPTFLDFAVFSLGEIRK